MQTNKDIPDFPQTFFDISARTWSALKRKGISVKLDDVGSSYLWKRDHWDSWMFPVGAWYVLDYRLYIELRGWLSIESGNRSRWRKSIRFTSSFYRRRILSAALCRFAFSCCECCCQLLDGCRYNVIRECLFRVVPTHSSTHTIIWIQVDVETRVECRRHIRRSAGTLLKLLAVFVILRATPPPPPCLGMSRPRAMRTQNQREENNSRSQAKTKILTRAAAYLYPVVFDALFVQGSLMKWMEYRDVGKVVL